jgi:antitoxin HicB
MMKYHFKVHKAEKWEVGFWAHGLELRGCVTQGDTREELEFNMAEALNGMLDEPEESKHIFPDPDPTLKGRNIVAVPVDPQIAFAMQVRQSRLKNKWTQKEAAKALGMKNIFSYQRLESSKTANPELSTLMRLCAVFPGFSVDRILDVGTPVKA